MSCRLVLAGLALSQLSLSLAATVPITFLTDPSARCLDGTQSAYYFQPATNASAQHRWVFRLNGGGECATQKACDAALTGPLGSSKYFAASMEMNEFLLDDKGGANPDFFDANHVFVPYCSQDLHSGQISSLPPDNSTWGLYFAGHLVFRAILDALEASASLKDATEIVLFGDSAGGLGVWMNVDKLGERYPSARVVAAPLAGFYFYAFPYTGVNHTGNELADFTPGAWPKMYALWDAFVDESCAAALPATPWVCMLSNFSFPYIAAGSFATEAQTDQVVLLDHDWIPADYYREAPEAAYLAAWRDNMTIALSPLMDPSSTRHGAFNPACFIHTGFTPTKPLIQGMSWITAFGNWFFQRTPPSQYKLADDCGILCNPTC